MASGVGEVMIVPLMRECVESMTAGRITLPDVNTLIKRQMSLNEAIKMKHINSLTRSQSSHNDPQHIARPSSSFAPPIQTAAPPTLVPIATLPRARVVKNESYSTHIIHDMDMIDANDPQSAATYAHDIYNYMRWLENEHRVDENYLGHGEITPKMRSALVKWLLQSQTKMELLSETFEMAVSLVDRYLSHILVPCGQLQLVGVTCLYIASKYEEVEGPVVNEFAYITDHTFTKRDIQVCEMKILGTLEFKLGRPLPIHFLRRFCKAANVNEETVSVAKCLMELSLTDYSQCHLAPSLIACGALYLAVRLVSGEFCWSADVAFYSRYKQTDVYPVSHKIAALAISARAQSNQPPQTWNADLYASTINGVPCGDLHASTVNVVPCGDLHASTVNGVPCGDLHASTVNVVPCGDLHGQSVQLTSVSRSEMCGYQSQYFPLMHANPMYPTYMPYVPPPPPPRYFPRRNSPISHGNIEGQGSQYYNLYEQSHSNYNESMGNPYAQNYPNLVMLTEEETYEQFPLTLAQSTVHNRKRQSHDFVVDEQPSAKKMPRSQIYYQFSG